MENILADRIRERLKAMGMNATKAALDSGLGKTAVRDIIAGKSKSPTVATLAALASTLDCTVSYLLGDAVHPAGFREEDADIRRVRIVPILGRLQAGTFVAPSPAIENFGRGVAYDSRTFSPDDILLYRLDDSSMLGLGILKGDVLTAVTNTKNIKLQQGDIVAVMRIITPPGIVEESLRQVIIDGDGKISLVTRPTGSAEGDSIPLDHKVPGGEGQRWVTPDNHGVEISGLVTRLVRDLPDNG